ncbi:hypothetical protein [Granulicella sibirica]|uniref:Uncharacterized protein n=1 Tax=Granulicella sibirica TaxID=2479048 RepID=A0A4Q0T272_9BACT|nr:hypothetical protein [Granulicella sibirica]RXH57755.1 hypothetical protein GRAN_1065 [Granulicella sibirica]
MPGDFLKRLFGGISKEPPSLSILPPASSMPRKVPPATVPASPPPRKPNLVPGNFYQFEFYIDLEIKGVVHIGYPKICIRTSHAIRWGSTTQWSYPTEGQSRIRWVDDPERGLATRNLEHIEDALGAEGRIGDMRLRFEKVLDLGDNVIVYALFCPEKNIRLAYGFDRIIFEPKHISASMRRRLANVPEKASSDEPVA